MAWYRDKTEQMETMVAAAVVMVAYPVASKASSTPNSRFISASYLRSACNDKQVNRAWSALWIQAYSNHRRLRLTDGLLGPAPEVSRRSTLPGCFTGTPLKRSRSQSHTKA